MFTCHVKLQRREWLWYSFRKATSLTVPLASIALSLESYETFGFSARIPQHTQLLRADGILYYQQMAAIRVGERIANEAFRRHLVRGFMHSSQGLEASCIGTTAGLEKPKSYVLCGYRSHGWAYAMGIPWIDILAELLGRRTGCSSSKGGSLHLFSKSFASGGVNPASPLSVGTGIAFAQRESGSIVVTVVDQDALSCGPALEAFHLAKLLSVPIIFLIENTFPGRCLTRGYGIPGLRVDGFNLLSVREATRLAVQHAAFKGPVLFEVNCFTEKQRDPMVEFRKLLLDYELATEQELTLKDDEVAGQAAEDLALAAAEFPPQTKELFNDVYADYLGVPVRGVGPWIHVFGGQSQRLRLRKMTPKDQDQTSQPETNT